MFENGTVVSGLVAATENDLANAAIAKLTGMTTTLRGRGSPARALSLGEDGWECCRPYATDNVWVRVASAEAGDAIRAADIALSQMDEDFGSLKIIHVAF
jgi:hypothetical protein